MIIKYKGYVIEGNVEEVRRFIRKNNKKYKRKKRIYKMTKTHKQAIGRAVSKMWREKNGK